MVNGKIIGIDARMIEMSGVGTYIQHLLNQGIYDYAFGDEKLIRKYDRDVKVIPYDAAIYSPKEQMFFPNMAAREANIQLMHFPHYNVPLSYHGKFIVTIHDLTHIVYPEFLGSKLKYEYARLLFHHALGKSEHILTDSMNSRKDIRKYFSVDDRKITVAYCGTDDAFTVKSVAEYEYLYGKYGIPRDKTILMYVGNLKPHKNVSRLIDALSELDNRDNYRLLLVGKAFSSVNLKNEENERGVENLIIHTGMVSKEELIDFYNLADVFVFPSLYEGFGLPPLEAMACGTPVIAADNSSIPEVVGDAAILFHAENVNSIKEAIIQVSETDTKQMISRGFKRYKLFRWDECVRIVRQVIAESV